MVATPRLTQATPTSVPLGTAGQFAVLAGSGITNTGATTINGDVGSSPNNAETGFAACPGANCVTLTGTNHTSPTPNDFTTQQAKVDQTVAYNYLAGFAPTQINTELAGQLLTAGVYASASGTFGMSGTLTLDGQNKQNQIFIFQMESTLITGGTGYVNLINGAQACNVYYQVGSAATLGAGSTLKGTVIAHDTISLGDGVTVQGRLLAGEQASRTGAVTLIHDTITNAACGTTPPGAPPVGTGGTPTGTGGRPTGGTTGTTTGTTGTSGTPTTPGRTPTGTTPLGTTPLGITPGTHTLTFTPKPSGTGIPFTATPVAATSVTTTPINATPFNVTPINATPTTATPTSPGPQVTGVPAGGVHTGDGSTVAAPSTGSGISPLLIDALALAGVAGIGGLGAVSALRRRRS